MDNTNYTTEHRKGQHLLSEERHEIEVRLKDGWSIYRIAKHLGRPYNTIKNEVKRGTVLLYNGKQKQYKADAGEQAYREHRENCRRVNCCLKVARFLSFFVSKFFGNEKWSLDAAFGYALNSGEFRRDESSARKHCTITWISACFRSRILTCLRSSAARPRRKSSVKTSEI
jgi:IS30 family transposase